MKIKLGISLILAFLAFVFIAQNTESVRVVFMAWSTEMSLVLLVFITLLCGILIGWLTNSFLRYTRHRKHQQRQNEAQPNAETPGAKIQSDVDQKGDNPTR